MFSRLLVALTIALAAPGSALAQANPPPAPYPPPPPQQTAPPPPPRSDYPPTQQGYPAPPQSYPQGYPPPAYPPPYPSPAYPPPYPPPAYPPPYPPPAYPPPAYPPPAAPAPSPGYGPSPYGGYQAPDELPYRAGQPIPNGYRLVEEPRYGLVTAGYLIAGIPYGLGLVVASGADFANATEWLAVPFVGPWLTMGQRRYHCDTNHGNTEDSADCLADVFVVMVLVMDGVMQTGGGALILSGYLSPKKTLVREDVAFTLRPIATSSVLGLAASGRF